jgi:tetratricopeptide (TPR) repeat protein
MRLAVLAGLLAFAGSASADIAYPREQPPPPGPRPAALVAPAPRAAIEIDPLAAIAGLAPALRPEQEQILVQLIQDTADSDVDEKADYYFRLATLYTAQQLHATRPDQAKMYLIKAVKAYKGLADNDAFRNYPKMDRALFLYGYTLQAGKYMKEARSVYDKLLKNYPDSVYVPAAHLAFADYYFAQHQFADAEARYKMVLKFPKSEAYAAALYKMGRIHFELQRYQDALETYFQVVQLAGTRADLRAAAEAGFVDAYAAIGKPDKARAAFERVDRPRAAELAGLYAQRSCATRIAGAANADTATRLEQTIALAHDAGEPCASNAAAMADELARAWHAEAASTHSLDTLAAARRAYAAFLALPATDDHEEMQAGYAELLWLNAALAPSPDRWAAAATAFAALPDNPDAISAGALAWKNALGRPPTDKPDVAAAARAHTRPRPMPAFEDQALTALEKLAGSLDDPDAIIDTRLFIAEHYRRLGHPERAIAPLADIVDQYPEHASAELAASLVLDSMLRARKADDARVYAADLASDGQLMTGKPALERDIAVVLRTSPRSPLRHR